MEDLQQEIQKTLHQIHSVNDRTFANEIKNIQNKRQNAIRYFLNNRRLLAQKIKFYTNKKQIIPSTLRIISSCNQPLNTKIFNKNYKNYKNASTNESDEQNDLQQSDKKQLYDKNQEKVNDKVQKNNKFLTKWKLEVSIEEKNCLNCRKQVNMNQSQRDKDLGEKKIRELYPSNLIKRKPNPTGNTVKNQNNHQIRIRNVNKPQSKTLFINYTSNNQAFRINKNNGLKYISIKKL